MKSKALMAAGIVALAGSTASALTLDASGTVLDWDITPFTGVSPGTETHANGVRSFYQNNYSPISYPGIGNVPSPGGLVGERFDLEEMHVRQQGSRVEMLLVRSSPFSASASGSTFLLGDILLDSTGNGGFDYGVVSQNANTGLETGGFYSVAETARLQNMPGSYYGHALESEIGPWAIASGSLLGQEDLVTTSCNYPGEPNTWLTVFAFDLEWMAVVPESLTFSLVWGCGNDKITGSFAVSSFDSQDPPDQPPQIEGAIPEPTTALLAFMALAGGGLAGMRRRR
ncbi:MAG: PEP-CTERM sorting domain-containing protein [Phycisphaeraceae bacterium]|nr:PEP-CTERM sorting domain-containing protein [Phycisphaeraceae bacterium]